MAKIQLFRGDFSALPSILNEGAVYVVQIDSETGQVYTDYNNQRIKISDTVLSKTSAEWILDHDLVSIKDQVYIFSDARSYVNNNGETVYVPGIKVGDGTSNVVDLPFVNVTAEQINFWNNKVTCYLASDLDNTADTETLVFSKN